MAGANQSQLRTDIPNSARVWDFWMGGKDNYEADRAAGEAGLRIAPCIEDIARESREFLIRAVSYLAGTAGVRQFLDIGTGLPTMQNTHQVAQQIAPDCRVLYVDHDPVVIAHARAMLSSRTAEGSTAIVNADFHEPETIIAEAHRFLDPSRPIAVMFTGVLGHARSYPDMLRVVRTMMAAVPSGSYLLLSDGTDDDSAYVDLCAEYAKTGGTPYVPRSRAEIAAAFDGLEPIPPGYTSITRWAGESQVRERAAEVPAYGGIARKP
ncbi:MAG: SAM-dependent methyltransferase [Nocardia sp.]|nr:SAM-dependent methyltransferase [Nocardia sp.]